MTKEQIKARIKQLKKQKQRLEYLSESQDTRQHAYKILLNSSYGVLGSVFYSCYDLDNAEAVTLSGQTVTREMVRFTNILLNELEGLSDDQYVIARCRNFGILIQFMLEWMLYLKSYLILLK